MKFRRFLSVLIGLSLIGLMVYKLIEVDRHNIPLYVENLPEFLSFLKPELLNTIIFYALFGIKVLTIFLIATGARKALIASLFFLPIVIAEIYYTHWIMIDLLITLFKDVGFSVFEVFDLSTYFYYAQLLLLPVFWIVLLIVVAANKAGAAASKVFLLIFALAPIALYYVDALVISDIDYKFELWNEATVALSFGLPLFFTIMLMLSQKGKEKEPYKNIWFPAIETI